ncbi:hypothetical protein ACFQX6_49700 [Streptosporangium lutulentum]
MATGLLATPAAAASGSTQATTAGASSATTARPAVWANTPSASTTRYEGACPAKVTFSTKIKVKAVDSTTKVSYRWLHGDGSKSSVKSFTLKGKGTKTVTVKETAAFKRDTKGWQAIQVLSPRGVTSGKKYFSVSCGNDWTVLNPPRKTSAQSWVSESNCKATLTGRISTSGSRWVRYQWVVNGRVVDGDTVRVNGSRTVSHVIKTHDDFRGWASLHIVGGPSSSRDYFKVSCKDWNPAPHPRVSVSVSAPGSYYGSCPTTRSFTGTISASHVRGDVKYRWVRDGVAGAWESVYFSGYGSQSRTVSDRWSTSKSDYGKRSIEVYNGPNSGTAVAKVVCKDENGTKKPHPRPVTTPEPLPSSSSATSGSEFSAVVSSHL